MTSLLIVEDDPHFRGALTRELESHGFVVHTAASAEDAIVILAHDEIDVLLTDLRLGGQDGIDLLRRLPALSRRTRTVLMSAYASARDHQSATDLGAVTVLVKPFTASELLGTIQKAIDCETGFQGSIHGLSLIDMAQMFHLAQRSICLHVSPPGEPPSLIHFERGEIVHAQHGNLTGAAALRAVLATPSGTIRTAALPDDVPHTIETAFGHLILESLSQLDEELHEAQRGLGPRTPYGMQFVDDDAAPALEVGSSFATDTLLADLESFEVAHHTAPTSTSPAPSTNPSTSPHILPDLTPPADPTTDTIYAAWRPVTRMAPSTPAPVPVAPPLQPLLTAACEALTNAIDAAVAAAIVDLGSGHLLGYHQTNALGGLADRTVAAALHTLFAGPALGRLAALGGRGDASALHQEIQLTSPQHYFFARVVADGKAAVALLTRKTINLGMGWALLRSNLGKLEPLLRQAPRASGPEG